MSALERLIIVRLWTKQRQEREAWARVHLSGWGWRGVDSGKRSPSHTCYCARKDECLMSSTILSLLPSALLMTPSCYLRVGGGGKRRVRGMGEWMKNNMQIRNQVRPLSRPSLQDINQFSYFFLSRSCNPMMKHVKASATLVRASFLCSDCEHGSFIVQMQCDMLLAMQGLLWSLLLSSSREKWNCKGRCKTR